DQGITLCLLDSLELPFDYGVMEQGELVERWWNGRFGRMSRRDVWLYKQTTWRVQCRIGDADNGKASTWDLADEKEARALVRRLLETGGDGWRDLKAGSVDAGWGPRVRDRPAGQ